MRHAAFKLVWALLILTGLCFAGDAGPCLDCHEGVVTSIATTIHTRVAGLDCQTCHPAAPSHVETGDTAGLIVDNPQQQCFSCHTDLTCDGEHCDRESFTCDNCHCVHHGSGPSMLKGDATKVCSKCHKDVAARMDLPNHHPVPEGKMTCISCHSPHRDSRASEATAADVNNLCWKCHSRYQGPFIFEHQPVIEDCRICHDAHGTVADNLLVQTEPFLCLQCHEFHFHAGLAANHDTDVIVGGVEFSNPNAEAGFKMAYGTKCTQCHQQIHGSDLPSQTVPGQGKGLLR
ncbi:MAG TPA: cytochrome c3 family protein [Thermoanaerobaculia bacterium]|nr:cytochrome c3 family protein [Thermoanaerobaculia bacterium]HUM30175.1 cytochrome c3 family protein [Thermoanaerobaculia bacterium]HXK68376.1 cytochrome c3 family protein [Thermoanaerobaculia bacterium]